jgi:hypothetical protein
MWELKAEQCREGGGGDRIAEEARYVQNYPNGSNTA